MALGQRHLGTCPSRRSAAPRRLQKVIVNASASAPAKASNKGQSVQKLGDIQFLNPVWGQVKSEQQFKGILQKLVADGKCPKHLMASWVDFYDNYKAAVTGSGVEGATEEFATAVSMHAAQQRTVGVPLPIGIHYCMSMCYFGGRSGLAVGVAGCTEGGAQHRRACMWAGPYAQMLQHRMAGSCTLDPFSQCSDTNALISRPLAEHVRASDPAHGADTVLPRRSAPSQISHCTLETTLTTTLPPSAQHMCPKHTPHCVFPPQVQASIADVVFNQFLDPYTFPSLHPRLLEPYNYYEFGQRYTGECVCVCVEGAYVLVCTYVLLVGICVCMVCVHGVCLFGGGWECELAAPLVPCNCCEC